jgi:hypothetical protein
MQTFEDLHLGTIFEQEIYDISCYFFTFLIASFAEIDLVSICGLFIAAIVLSYDFLKSSSI